MNKYLIAEIDLKIQENVKKGYPAIANNLVKIRGKVLHNSILNNKDMAVLKCEDINV